MPNCDLCDDEDAFNYCAECSYHFCNLCCEAVHEDRDRMKHVVQKVGPAAAPHADAPPVLLQSAAPSAVRRSPPQADETHDPRLRTPLQDKSNGRHTIPTAKPAGDHHTSALTCTRAVTAPLLDPGQPPAGGQPQAGGPPGPAPSDIPEPGAPSPPAGVAASSATVGNGARPLINLTDSSVVYSLPAAAPEPTVTRYGQDMNSCAYNGSSLATLPPVSRSLYGSSSGVDSTPCTRSQTAALRCTPTNASAEPSAQLAQLQRMESRNEDVLDDLLALYGSNQGRLNTALRGAPPSAALPLNHMSLYSSGSGMQPSAGLRSSYHCDPKRSTPTNVGDALRMSMNDIDVLKGPGAAPPSIWASAAGRASPAGNLRSTMPNLPNIDLYSSTGSASRGFVSSLDAQDPKRVTRSDIVSAQWPWQQENNNVPARELSFADRPLGPVSLPAGSSLPPGLKPPTGNALGIETPKCGLGVRLRHSNRGLLSVASILPGGAADTSGMLIEGDQILAVHGVETFGKPIQEVAKMFVGDEGTTVTLRISRGDTPPHDVSLVRKAFQHVQAPASAPLPPAPKSALGSGIPPRAPVKVEDKIDANTDENAEPAKGVSSVAGSTAAAMAVRDADRDVFESQHASVASAVSAVFEESPLKVRHLHDDAPLFDRPSTSISHMAPPPQPSRHAAPVPASPQAGETAAAGFSPAGIRATAHGGSSDTNTYISPMPPADASLCNTTQEHPAFSPLPRPVAMDVSPSNVDSALPAGIPAGYLNCTSEQSSASTQDEPQIVKQLSTPMSPRTKRTVLANIQASPSLSAAIAPSSAQTLSAPVMIADDLSSHATRAVLEEPEQERVSMNAEQCALTLLPVLLSKAAPEVEESKAEGSQTAPAAPVDDSTHESDADKGCAPECKPQVSFAKLRGAFEPNTNTGGQNTNAREDPTSCSDNAGTAVAGMPPPASKNKNAVRDDVSTSTAASTDGQMPGRHTVMPSPISGQSPIGAASEQPLVAGPPANQEKAAHPNSSVPAHWKIDPDKVVMEGWLSKETKGNFMKSTQKRWCVLKHGNLSYFHKKTDKAPAASIDLVHILGVNVDSSKNTHALVVTCRDRVYKFVQPDKTSCFKWLQAITEAIPSAPAPNPAT